MSGDLTIDDTKAAATPRKRVARRMAKDVPQSGGSDVASRAAMEARTERIIIEATEHDSNDVPVAINGKTWLIKRGVPVDVPEAVVEVLHNSRQPKTFRSRDANGRERVETRDVLCYPFTRLSH